MGREEEFMWIKVSENLKKVKNWYVNEDGYLYDMFSIKVCKFVKNAQTVGHLHMEISRITHFVLQRGPSVSANICGKHSQEALLSKEGFKFLAK